VQKQLDLCWSFGPADSAAQKGLDLHWSFGAAKPIQQRKNNWIYACRSGWPIQQHKKDWISAGRSGQPNRFSSTKTIGFVLVVRASPADSAVQKGLVLGWLFGPAQPIQQPKNDWFCAGCLGQPSRFSSPKRIGFVLVVWAGPTDSAAQIESC
jgi:hypothetical protein